MKFVQTVLFYILVIELSYVLTLENEETKASRDLNKRDSTMCTSEKCIMKCCPDGKYVNTVSIYIKGRDKPRKKRICDYFDTTKNITNLNNGTKIIFSNHPQLSIFQVKPGIFEANRTYLTQTVDVTNLTLFNVYLTDYPQVHLEMPNAYERWTHIPNSMFCWDFKIKNGTGGANKTLSPGIWVLLPESPDEPSRTSDELLTTAMLVSCFFLLVVLVVYGLLKELRNLCGRILMAYVASLFGALFLLAMMRIQQHNLDICLGLTCCIYYLFLASFCWMNVMSYDIWWTFRGYAKARPIHRRGENFKFLMYCLYAWGLPLPMAIAIAILNDANLRDFAWLITPKIPINGCFIEGGEKFLYLYIPMLILILCNWMFYILTAYNVWRLSRGTAVLDSGAAGTPQAHRNHRNRFLVYLKLSIVMGLNWLLEVVSYKYPGYSAWFISDFYNILIGVSIFLIFVCKRNILRKLMKLFIRCKKSHWRKSQLNSVKSTSSASDSSASQETQTLQVCCNPKGPAQYTVKSV